MEIEFVASLVITELITFIATSHGIPVPQFVKIIVRHALYCAFKKM